MAKEPEAMPSYSRRDLLRMGATLAAGLALGRRQTAALAQGLEKILRRQARVLWLQGMSCSGCSVSFLNIDEPTPLDLLTETICLVHHSTLSAAQGEQAVRLIDEVAGGSDYLLIVEGAIPLGMPEACQIGGVPLTTRLAPIVGNARAIIAAGTCAAFGGIPAAEGNATHAVAVREYMRQQRLPTERRLINCPGCPVHPQSLLGTVAYVIGAGYPQVNPTRLTPDMFYQHSVHDECPRFHYWEKRIFAKQFGDEGCLFKLGCLGPLSHTDCPRRQWNGGVNWCVRAGAPCLACTSEDFARLRDFPFYRKGEAYHPVAYREDDRTGARS